MLYFRTRFRHYKTIRRANNDIPQEAFYAFVLRHGLKLGVDIFYPTPLQPHAQPCARSPRPRHAEVAPLHKSKAYHPAV